MILNTLVIITILKSTQLRKKLCYFMIMVLSCCDLTTVFLGIITVSLRLTFWLTENYALLTMIETYDVLTEKLACSISMLVLLVMSIERYLGVYYPLFHRTSVTRRRLLTLLGILTIFALLLLILSLNEMVIPIQWLRVYFRSSTYRHFFSSTTKCLRSPENFVAGMFHHLTKQSNFQIYKMSQVVCSLLPASCFSLFHISFTFSFPQSKGQQQTVGGGPICG